MIRDDGQRWQSIVHDGRCMVAWAWCTAPWLCYTLQVAIAVSKVKVVSQCLGLHGCNHIENKHLDRVSHISAYNPRISSLPVLCAHADLITSRSP